MSRPLNPWKLSGYKPGQNVVCKVTNAEPGGYAVLIPKDNLPGFLPTSARLRTGEEILAQFVCVHNNRILLSARFSNTSAAIKTQAHESVRWEDQLNTIDQAPAEEYLSSEMEDAPAAPYITPDEPMQGPGGSPFAQPYSPPSEHGTLYTPPPPNNPPSYSPSPPPYIPAAAPPAYTPPPAAPAFTQQPAVPAYTQPPAAPAYNQPPAAPAYTQPAAAPPAYTPPPAAPAYTQHSGPNQAPMAAPRAPQRPPGPATAENPAVLPQSPVSPARQAAPPPTPPSQGGAHPGTPKQLLQTHVQTPQVSDAEAAFEVWAQSQPRRFHLKRATDLILPPVNTDSEQQFKIADYDLEWLITHLEGGMTTGCVKASSEERLSRSAMLLYRGRAVGCIYGCKSMPETQPTEQSLQHMLADLELPETQVRMYDLPENVTLAMSALFLGYPVQRNDDYDARAYMDYICDWFKSKGQTACLAITLPSSAATCLGFVYKGHFAGAFYVEDQKFTEDIAFVHDLLKTDPKANVEASILPPEMTSSAVRFGFSLSMARTRREGL